MAGGSAGTIFVELDLDKTRYLRNQQLILQEAQSGATVLEKNFKNLQIKSDASFDLMRAQAVQSYERIKSSGQATANDLVNAEKAKTARLNALNTEQFGHQTTLLESLKKNWMAVSVAAYAAYAAIQKGVDIIGSWINAASNLQEVQGKFNVVFAGQERQAESWAKTLVSSYAMSEREAKQYLSSVQDLLVPMGMAASQAGIMANEVVKLSADLGSFNNMPTAQVMADIQSALVGNFETMKKYGVVLNATVVQEKALAMGLAETKDELTAGEKAQAAYALMVSGSTAAIGDMARTSGNYANQMKLMAANLEDFRAALGERFIPTVTEAIKSLNFFFDIISPTKLTLELEKQEQLKKEIIKWEIRLTDLQNMRLGDYSKSINEAKYQIAAHNAQLVTSIAITKGIVTEESVLAQKRDKNAKDIWKILDDTTKNLTKAEKEKEKQREKDYQAFIEDLKDKEKFEADYSREVIKIAEDKQRREEGIKEKSYRAFVDDLKDKEKRELDYSREVIKIAEDKAAAESKAAAKTAETIKAELDLKSNLLEQMGAKDEAYYLFKQTLADAHFADMKTKYEGNAEMIEIINAAELEAATKLNQEKLLLTGTFFDGLKIGYDRSLKDQTTWAQAGLSVFDSFTNETRSMLSDNFFNIFTGRMDELSLDWESMWQGMARTAADKLAEIATNKAMEAAVSGVDWLGGAMGWWASGAWDIKKDQMAMLHKDEMVIPATEANKIRDAGDANASLGESWGNRTGFAPGTYGAYVEQSVLDSLMGSARGFGLGKVAGLATTGQLALGLNPMGLAAVGVKAAVSGLYATYEAYKNFNEIYGKDLAMDWSASMPGAPSAYGGADVYDLDFGTPSDYSDFSEADFGGDYGDTDTSDYSDFGEADFHKGGRLNLRSDEGYFKGQRGEEVVTQKNIERLEKLINGAGRGNSAPLVYIGGNLIADKQTFNDFVDQIDYSLNKKSKRVYQ